MTARARFHVKALAHVTARDRLVEVEAGSDGIRIGRAAGLELPLPFAAVSALHARVVRGDDGWRLEDRGSSNGTFIGCGAGERRLAKHESTSLRAGECVRIADVVLVFEAEGTSSEVAVRGTGTIARRLVADLFGVMRPNEVATLAVTGGAQDGQTLRLEEAGRAYSIGRAPLCDLVLDDVDASRKHATVERGFDGLTVRDLGSKNGVKVDGAAIEGPTRVADGALIEIGGTRLRVNDPEQRYLQDAEAAAKAELLAQTEAAPAPEAAVAEGVASAGVATSTPSEVVEPHAPVPEVSPVAAAPAVVPRVRSSAAATATIAIVVLLAVAGALLWLTLGG